MVLAAVVRFFTLAVLACIITQGSAQRSREGRQRWSVFEYPNPQYDYSQCGRPNTSSVCDPNGIISRQDADIIDGLISALYRETICQCYDCITNKHGHIIKVALMPEMERVFPDGENTTLARLRDAQMYSYILTQRWRMEGACNESLLILFSRNDGILYTLTRQITRIKLSDEDVKKISLIVRHFFDRPETIASGLREMIHRYRLIFENKHSEAFQSVTQQG
ncbi:unnamed protein product [Candidula unifasciata]|uniref:Uncharacterized protein n=1 Tax=Candidula unifasciata TaxID=100452 RepID=A0A8S3ZEX6_9EUPU|nr:unnamed protein product [Candidula unifasciata]